MRFILIAAIALMTWVPAVHASAPDPFEGAPQFVRGPSLEVLCEQTQRNLETLMGMCDGQSVRDDFQLRCLQTAHESLVAFAAARGHSTPVKIEMPTFEASSPYYAVDKMIKQRCPTLISAIQVFLESPQKMRIYDIYGGTVGPESPDYPLVQGSFLFLSSFTEARRIEHIMQAQSLFQESDQKDKTVIWKKFMNDSKVAPATRAGLEIFFDQHHRVLLMWADVASLFFHTLDLVQKEEALSNSTVRRKAFIARLNVLCSRSWVQEDVRFALEKIISAEFILAALNWMHVPR